MHFSQWGHRANYTVVVFICVEVLQSHISKSCSKCHQSTMAHAAIHKLVGIMDHFWASSHHGARSDFQIVLMFKFEFKFCRLKETMARVTVDARNHGRVYRNSSIYEQFVHWRVEPHRKGQHCILHPHHASGSQSKAQVVSSTVTRKWCNTACELNHRNP